MAEYGSRDKNPFNVPKEYKINGVATKNTEDDQKRRYYLLVDSVTGETTVKSADGKLPSVAGGNTGMDRIVGTIPKDGVFKPFEPSPSLTSNQIDPPSSSEIKYFTSAQGQKDVKNHAVITAKNAGAQNAQQLIFPNSATPGAGQGQSVAAAEAAEAAGAAKISDANANKEDISNIGDAAGKYKGRTEYSGKTNALKYPLNMDKNQDCIKFTVIEYRPSKSGVGGSAGRPTVDTGNLISQIVLPMPSAIVDSNPVDWGAGRLDMGTQAFSDAIMGFLDSGTKGAEVGARKTIDEITKNKGLMEKIIKAKTLESALGTTNLLSRLEGLAFNPSLELLFGGPSLRNFSFSFKMNPRSEDEAKMVRSIIRTFKQTMSVKRSESTFILRAPHTFKISYLLGHSGKPHPYLNRFKECALTNCSVNYTPDGQYMSYSGAERSMTAYELQLQFQELEPIFDDDYDNDQDGASAKFENIGY